MNYVTDAPELISFSGLTKCNFPSLSSAIKIMPLLSMPLIFLGARLATTTTCFPIISSGLKCNAIPETIVLFSKPRSISSFKSLSAFSTFSAEMIVPTLRSIFEKSSKTYFRFHFVPFYFHVYYYLLAGCAIS